MGSNPVWRITLPSATECTRRGVRIPQPTVTSVVRRSRMLHDDGNFSPDS